MNQSLPILSLFLPRLTRISHILIPADRLRAYWWNGGKRSNRVHDSHAEMSGDVAYSPTSSPLSCCSLRRMRISRFS